MKNRLVTVFGGSGFVGRYIVQRLATAGARVRVAVRDTEEADFLKTCGDLGQISFVPASITSDAEVTRAVNNADFVVNCVGILFERGARSFNVIHNEAAARVAKAAKAAGAKRFVQLSALGADTESESAYARSKAAGEQAVMAAFPEATILRPSVIFGPEDGFFNMFAELARISPVLPYFTSIVPHAEGGGGTKFQPVYVDDVAEAAVSALIEDDYEGKIYELVGPTVYTMREILEMIRRYTDRDTWICGLPFWVARIQAIFLQFLPTPLLTPDQVKLLRIDNIADGNTPGLEAFGISPETAESIVPTYLRRFRPYQQLKKIRLDQR
jgi:NADH dehydrogenase